jgi:hypothetical protein
MRNAAAFMDGRALTRSYAYTLWDADRIQGCVCDEGFSGYDCSVAACPKGADPLKVSAQGLVPEVQTVTCLCPGTCSGYVVASFNGQVSDPIYANATASISSEDTTTPYGGTGVGQSVEARIEALSRSDLIKTITMSTTEFCSSGGGGTVTTITFNNRLGDVPLLSFDFSSTLLSDGVSADSGASISLSVATTQASTITPQECSGRGVCNAGSCKCGPGFDQSNGNGGSGTIGDCGYATTVITACPTTDASVVCSGHGSCGGAPNYLCTCSQGWSGIACSERACPTGIAWFDEATANDLAHQRTTCSNMGNCQPASGLCSCRTGFTGGACSRMQCPTDRLGNTCGGRGRCLSLAQLAPLGSQMGTYANNGKNEIQKMVCNLATGTFQLTFRFATTSSISVSATALQLRDALESLFPVQFVSVTLSPDNGVVCSAGGGETAYIEFTHNYGDLPLITSSSASVVITEHQKGSRVSYGDRAGSAATWDAHMIHACHCDSYPDYNNTLPEGDRGRYAGPACTQRTCPIGADPFAPVPIRYRISCKATGGTLKLSFTSAETATLAYNVDASGLRTALLGLSTVSAIYALEMPSSTLCASVTSTTDVWLETTMEPHQVIDLAFVPASTALTGAGATSSVTRVSSAMQNEKQTILCMADSGSFALSFRGHKTAAIAYNADEAAVKAALEALASIGVVTVSMEGTAPKSVCSTSGVSTDITFVTQLGDVEAFQADAALLGLTAATASVAVSENEKGTTRPTECSSRGYCDTTTGTCHCLAGYVSGNGVGGLGARGDCGAVDHYFANTHPTEWAIANLKR